MVIPNVPIFGARDRRESGQTDRRSPRITVIDQYPEFVSLMEAVLAERSCTVTGLDVPDARVSDVAATVPDLVIVGIGPLPSDAARSLFLWARGHAALVTVPFLIVTSDPDVVPLGTSPDAVITLPFKLPELLDKVEDMLRRRPAIQPTSTSR